MTISTNLSKSYAIRLIILAVLCAAFAAWAAFDLWVTIPRRERQVEDYRTVKAEFDELGALAEQPGGLTADQRERYAELENTLTVEVPEPPGRWDRLTQWIYIALCAPSAPWFMWHYLKMRRRRFRLDENGALHHPEGIWTADEIVDIDMNRWMSKSVAHAVHRDGRRLKLDDYVYRNTHLIVGAIASRHHPDQWLPDAKPAESAETRKPENAETGDQDSEP